VSDKRCAPAALPPGMTWYPFCMALGGAPGPFWTGAENLGATGICRARSELLFQPSRVLLGDEKPWGLKQVAIFRCVTRISKSDY